MNIMMKKLLVCFMACSMVFHSVFQPMALSAPVPETPPVTVQAPEDTDGDGLTDLEEAVIGTDPKNQDSDEDLISDGRERALGLDPLNPDMNGDGLSDYEEVFVRFGDENPNTGEIEIVFDSSLDTDQDGTPNLMDRDNDNDGVPDGLDISPFALGPARDTVQFNLETRGNPTYVDLSLRPAKPDHIGLPDRAWDWPFDERGQMQDMDNSNQDLRIQPVLELNISGLRAPLTKGQKEEMAAYGMNVQQSDDAATANIPLFPLRDDGKIVSLDGRIFLPEILTEAGLHQPQDLTLEGRLVWMVSADSEKSDLNWTDLSSQGLRSRSQGGGMALADLNQNNRPDLILMRVKNKVEDNVFEYCIGWDLDENGTPSGGWSALSEARPPYGTAGLGDSHAGGGPWSASLTTTRLRTSFSWPLPIPKERMSSAISSAGILTRTERPRTGARWLKSVHTAATVLKAGG